MMIVKIKIPKN